MSTPQQPYGPIVYDLTPLLRGAAAERRTVIKTVDLPRKTLLVIVLSFPVGLVLLVLLRGLMRIARLGDYTLYAVMIVPVTVLTAVILFRHRSSTGLRQTHWRTIRDRRRAKPRIGQVFVRGVNVDPDQTVFGELVPAWRPHDHLRAGRIATHPGRQLPNMVDGDEWARPVEHSHDAR